VGAWYDEPIAAVTAAFKGRDFDGLRRHLHPDVVFDFSRSIGPGMGVYEGFEGVREFFDGFIEAWDQVDWQVTEVEELALDRLLITTWMGLRGRGSGVEIDARGAQLLEFTEGKVVRITFFQRRDEAAAELGL
jgi:ketosteroid isomerase-like protein